MGPAVAPEVSPGDHACCVFASDDDQASLIGRFATDALSRGDRFLYLADRCDEAAVTDFLDDAGLKGRERLDAGELQVLHSSQMGLEDGFDRGRQLGVWRDLIGLARADGYRALAVAVEMSWALSWKVPADALIDYEATSAEVFASGELSALCQYDRRLFDAEVIERAGHAHRYGLAVRGSDFDVHYHRLRLRGDATGRTLAVGGEIDRANVRFLEAQLSDRLAGGDVVVDCSELTFVDVAGCRLFHEASTGDAGLGRVELRNAPPALTRVMNIINRVESER